MMQDTQGLRDFMRYYEAVQTVELGPEWASVGPTFTGCIAEDIMQDKTRREARCIQDSRDAAHDLLTFGGR